MAQPPMTSNVPLTNPPNDEQNSETDFPLLQPLMYPYQLTPGLSMEQRMILQRQQMEFAMLLHQQQQELQMQHQLMQAAMNQGPLDLRLQRMAVGRQVQNYHETFNTPQAQAQIPPVHQPPPPQAAIPARQPEMQQLVHGGVLRPTARYPPNVAQARAGPYAHPAYFAYPGLHHPYRPRAAMREAQAPTPIQLVAHSQPPQIMRAPINIHPPAPVPTPGPRTTMAGALP